MNINFNRIHSLKPIEVEKYSKQRVEIHSRETNLIDSAKTSVFSKPTSFLFNLNELSTNLFIISTLYVFHSTSMDFHPGARLGSSFTSDILPINNLGSYIEPFSRIKSYLIAD